MIINPSPGPSPISITIEHGKIENKKDIAKTVNVSLRLVKFLINKSWLRNDSARCFLPKGNNNAL